MSFMKKQGAGFYFAALTLIAAVVGLAAYLVNCGTAYFSNLGTSPLVVATAIVGIAAMAVYIAVGEGIVADIMPVIAGAALMVSMGQFVALRVNGIAAIMTFTNNAQNMADLSSAIVGIAALVIAAVLNMIGSFLSMRK